LVRWEKVVRSEIFEKLPKVNNRPMGENSPNLATLAGSNNGVEELTGDDKMYEGNQGGR
jgi:hypothetical protein